MSEQITKRLQAWRDGAGTAELESVGGIGYFAGNEAFASDVCELLTSFRKLEKQNAELLAALQKVATAVDQFRRDWRRVPYFADRVNKATREAMSIAFSPIINLDAIGGPLDSTKILSAWLKTDEGKAAIEQGISEANAGIAKLNTDRAVSHAALHTPMDAALNLQPSTQEVSNERTN